MINRWVVSNRSNHCRLPCGAVQRTATSARFGQPDSSQRHHFDTATFNSLAVNGLASDSSNVVQLKGTCTNTSADRGLSRGRAATIAASPLPRRRTTRRSPATTPQSQRILPASGMQAVTSYQSVRMRQPVISVCYARYFAPVTEALGSFARRLRRSGNTPV